MEQVLIKGDITYLSELTRTPIGKKTESFYPNWCGGSIRRRP